MKWKISNYKRKNPEPESELNFINLNENVFITEPNKFIYVNDNKVKSVHE